MSPGVAALVGEVEVRIAGAPLDPILASHLLEVRAETHATLPDMFVIRIADPEVKHVDDRRLRIGALVEIRFGPPDKRTLTLVLQGQITALEPEFSEREVVLTVRGYDRSHVLNRTRRTQTYQSMSISEIVRKVAVTAGLTPGTVDATGGPLAFVQQTNETDLAFVWRLARSVGFEVAVAGRQLSFRRPGAAPAPPVAIRWGAELQSFRPRVTGLQQIAEVVVRGWDPLQKQAIAATTRVPAPASSIGLSRPVVVGALGGGRLTIADRPVASMAEATALARAVAAELASGFVEADGVCRGDPRLQAGTKLRVTGVGTHFGGTYTLTQATHVFRTAGGYHTHFRVAAGHRGPLTGLAAPEPSSWRHGVVVGLVTNNRDPMGLGRVRVKYPALDPQHEGWWARITAPSAGADRGLLMMPQPGDEVLLAFEHDADEHPYVIGALWNGRARPASLVETDGSFVLRSDRQIVAHAIQGVSVASDTSVNLQSGTDTTIEARGAWTGKSAGAGTLESAAGLTMRAGTSATVQAGTSVAVEAGESVSVSGGAEVTVQAGGTIQIRGASIEVEAAGSIKLVAPQIMLG